MNASKFKLSLIAAGLQLGAIAFSSSTSAAGFFLHEHSANGLGRAFAGQAAMPENATVLYSNAAAITAFDEKQFSVFASYIDPGIDVEGEVTIGTPAGELTLDASQDSISDSEIVPATFYVQPINDKWSAGVGLFANFGLSTDFDDGYNALHFADRAEITALVINPTLAYKINDQLSIGLGISATHVEAELGTSVPAVISAAVGGLVPANAAIAKMEGDDWGYGYNLGIYWTPTDSTSIGASYRSTTRFTLEGDLESEVLAELNQGGTLNLDLPAQAELAINQQINDSLSIQASATWFKWSTFDVLNAELDNGEDLLIGEERFENNWKLSLGVTYALSNEWTLRAGYAFDEGAATDEHRSLSIPDTDRHWYSVGATYQLDDAINVDFGVLKVIGEKVDLTDQAAVGPLTSTLTASQESSATILSAQLNYSF